MSTTPGAEKVFPAGGTSPAAGGAPAPAPAGKGKRGGMKLDRKTVMWGGAGAVALFAFLSTRGGAAEDDPAAMSIEPAEYDSTAEDLYTNLQPEFEAIGDAIRDTPAPKVPDINVTFQQPKANNDRKNKGKKKQQQKYYRVKRGDKLWQIANQFGVSNRKLFTRNKAKLNKAAQRRGLKHAHGGNKIFPGTRLAIPKKK